MIDIDEAIKQVMLPTDRCPAKMEKRGTLWTCARPEGHDGCHAAVDMTLRYFDGEGTEGTLAGRISFRSRLLARERD